MRPAVINVTIASFVLAAAVAAPAPGAVARVASAQTAAAAPSVSAPEPPHELLPMERAELERRVRDRCGVGSETPDSFLPWYYHYVLGMEFHRAGDETHALDCLKSAVARRPQPKSGARVYGMWFVDYLPYTALAEVNERLGYVDCAEDARRLALALEPPKGK